MRNPITAITLLALAGGGLACGFGGSSEQAPPPITAPSTPERVSLLEAPVEVLFEVTGKGEADITYAYEYGQTPTRLSAETPWRTTTTRSLTEPVMLVTLTARATGTSTDTTIGCRVTIGGNVILVEKTAHGPRAEATCSTVPSALTT
ncbi:MmpS family protein [Actinoplanes hulinensis]|uniref:MmpS family protein n=1 Tax=Actinoplanes hulinensis TaxID=1144547 RepID=A0ABS7B3U0_9ACTN|nr:MmpS family transport accessory protein [Actinoplanes hulinensis]MBW6435707.1 MmpS family protein [Actinoplanes hulinensis]